MHVQCVSPCVPFHTKYPVRQQWRWACNQWACNLCFCATHNMGGLATPYTNHQQHTNTLSTANHSASKYRNQAQKLEEKQSCKEIGAHQTDNRRVGWDHQIHTSRLPRIIRNHMYTRLCQVPFQLCLTTSLLGTDRISHEGPRFFTLVQTWRTSMTQHPAPKDADDNQPSITFEVLSQHQDVLHLHIEEAMAIQSLRPPLNRRDEHLGTGILVWSPCSSILHKK